MSMLNSETAWLRICGLTLGLVLGPSPALAGTGSFGIPLQAITTSFGASFAGDAISLPESGSPSFLFSFVMPRDYVNDQEVRIVLYLATDRDPPCAARFIPNHFARSRIGLPQVRFNFSGLSVGSPSVEFPDQAILGKVVRLRPGTAMPGQRRGDAFVVQIYRDADHVSDTCPSVSLQAIDIRYPTP